MLKFYKGFGYALASLLVIVPAAVGAIGQLSQPIIQEGLLQGQQFSVEIKPFNSVATVQIFELTTRDQVAGWAKFYATEDREFKIPIQQIEVLAQSSASAIAVSTIPAGTPNGVYEGGVVVSTKKTDLNSDQAGANISVSDSVSRQVLITVTDQQNVAFNVQVIPDSFDVDNNGALKVRFIYENTGNVDVRPDVRLTITELATGQLVHEAIYSYPAAEAAVKVRTKKDMTYLNWSASGQNSGRYRAELAFMVNGISYSENEFKFTIGSFAAVWLASLGSFIGGNLVWLWSAIAGILLIVAVVFRMKMANKAPLAKAVGSGLLAQLGSKIRSLF